MKKLIAIMISSVLISACGGSHPLPSPAPPAPVPDTACGIATVSPTALSDGIRFIDPLNLSDAGGLSEHPSIASASGGKVYAAWDDDKNLDKDIFFRQSNDYGSSYQDIVNVSRTGVATFPSLAVGKNGTVHLAWQDLTTGPSEIRYSRSINDGVSFSDSTQISSQNPVDNTTTQEAGVFVAVAGTTAATGAGNIYIAWSQSTLNGAQFALKVARSTDNGVNFSDVDLKTYVPANNASVSSISMTVDSAGNLHLSWAETEIIDSIPIRHILHAVSTDQGVNFTTPVKVETGDNLSLTTITTDPTNINRIYIAWLNSDEERIHFSSSNDGGKNFSTPVVVVPEANPLSKQLSPRLAVGVDGILYLAWTDNRTGNYDTFVSNSTNNGSTFTAPVSISPSAQGSLFTAISVDDEDNVYIAADDNRFPNPPDTGNDFGNQGNFEILLARGKFNLPAVQSASAQPCPFTPNGDDKDESTNIKASFSEELNWTLTIAAQDGTTVVHQETGIGSVIKTTWDGTNDGVEIEDGVYTYKITGRNADNVGSTAANGSVILYRAAEDAVPEIISFSREAFGFSPNGDGFKDSDGITAQFNKPVNWKIEIEDSGSNLVRTLTGSGIVIDSNVTRWDGKNDLGIELAEGTYTVSLSAIDGLGLTASCGRIPIPCLIMEIDITPPAIENIKIDVATFRPSLGQTITITGEPSELALVTIYVYNQVGVLTRQVDRNFRDANTPFEEIWDGKDSNGNLVTPGKYTFNAWCRDRAGNTAPIYPYELNFTVAIE